MILNEKQKEFIQNSINHLDAGKLGASIGNSCAYVVGDKFCIVGCNIQKNHLEYVTGMLCTKPVMDLPKFILDELAFKPCHLKILQVLHDTWAICSEMNFKRVLELILSGNIKFHYVGSNYGVKLDGKYFSLISREKVFEFYSLNNLLEFKI